MNQTNKRDDTNWNYVILFTGVGTLCNTRSLGEHELLNSESGNHMLMLKGKDLFFRYQPKNLQKTTSAVFSPGRGVESHFLAAPLILLHV